MNFRELLTDLWIVIKWHCQREMQTPLPDIAALIVARAQAVTKALDSAEARTAKVNANLAAVTAMLHIEEEANEHKKFDMMFG
jgi:hypothetical protein